MTPEYRKQLESLLAKTRTLIAECEMLTVAPVIDDDALLSASKSLAELREKLTKIERKLNNPNQLKD